MSRKEKKSHTKYGDENEKGRIKNEGTKEI